MYCLLYKMACQCDKTHARVYKYLSIIFIESSFLKASSRAIFLLGLSESKIVVEVIYFLHLYSWSALIFLFTVLTSYLYFSDRISTTIYKRADRR